MQVDGDPAACPFCAGWRLRIIEWIGEPREWGVLGRLCLVKLTFESPSGTRDYRLALTPNASDPFSGWIGAAHEHGSTAPAL